MRGIELRREVTGLGVAELMRLGVAEVVTLEEEEEVVTLEEEEEVAAPSMVGL